MSFPISSVLTAQLLKSLVENVMVWNSHKWVLPQPLNYIVEVNGRGIDAHDIIINIPKPQYL